MGSDPLHRNAQLLILLVEEAQATGVRFTDGVTELKNLAAVMEAIVEGEIRVAPATQDGRRGLRTLTQRGVNRRSFAEVAGRLERLVAKTPETEAGARELRRGVGEIAAQLKGQTR